MTNETVAVVNYSSLDNLGNGTDVGILGCCDGFCILWSSLHLLHVFGIVGNAAVIVGVRSNKRLHTPTFIGIGALALADLLLLLNGTVERVFMIYLRTVSCNSYSGAQIGKIVQYSYIVAHALLLL